MKKLIALGAMLGLVLVIAGSGQEVAIDKIDFSTNVIQVKTWLSLKTNVTEEETFYGCLVIHGPEGCNNPDWRETTSILLIRNAEVNGRILEYCEGTVTNRVRAFRKKLTNIYTE